MSTPRKLLYSLLPVLLLLMGAELGARLVGPPPSHLAQHVGGAGGAFLQQDPALGWRYAPGSEIPDPVWGAWAASHQLSDERPDELPVNSWGMRDEPIDPDKPAGQQRVYCMGDSSVLGSGVLRSDTFSERLERALDPTDSGSVEVLNGGVAGYSSFQALALLEQRLPLKPDLVVAYLMNSDLMEFRGSPDRVWFKRWYRGVDLSLVERSHAVRWLSWWRSYYFPFRRSPDGLLLRVRVEDFAENLRGLVALGQREGFETIFVLPPTRGDLRHPEELNLYRNPDRWKDAFEQASEAEHWTGQTRAHFRMAMLLEGQRASLPVIDAPAAFVAHRGEEPLFVDELHPSSEGHALLTELLLPQVQAALER